MTGPQSLYQASSLRARKIINKAIFGKLYVQADEQGPYIARDELNEPFETIVYARRSSRPSEALEQAEARLAAGLERRQALGDLLVAALGSPCSSKNRMVALSELKSNSRLVTYLRQCEQEDLSGSAEILIETPGQPHIQRFGTL